MLSVVLFSTLLTLIITAAQLYRDYSSDVSRIETQLQQVNDVHLRSLSALLWVSDIDGLKTLAEGIMQLGDMQYLEISDEEKQWIVIGKAQEADVISRQFPLSYRHRDDNVDIGALKLVASLDGVYARLYDKVIVILVSNAIKTFLVAIFIFIVFHFLVTRHIIDIAAFTKVFDIDEKKKLILDRKASGHDELDDLVDAYNAMQSRLARSIENLKDSTARFRSLVEYSDAIPWTLDLDAYRFTYVGKQAEKILSYPLQDWYEKDFCLTHVHPDDAEFVRTYCRKKTEQGKDFEFEYRMLAADGSIVWIRNDVSVVQENGNPVRLQGFMFDITEQKSTEEALQQSYDALEEKVAKRTHDLMHAKNDAERANRLKTEFLGRVSHELRTPMNAILGFGQLLQGEKLQPTQQESLSEIMHAGEHLLYLIDDVLDLSVVETGNVNLSFQDFRMDEWMQECLTMVQAQATKRGISIHADLDCSVDTCLRMDRERLKEVLVNILTNAIKYNADDGEVTVYCQRPTDDKLRIHVADTGPGLTHEQQLEMFEPFNRLGAEYSETQGTGIGLTIARRLMTQMDGDMGVQSAPGEGSIFWIECNICPPIVQSSGQPIQDPELTVVSSADTLKVLCIEDNLANMRLIEKILATRAEVDLSTVQTAEKGLEFARELIPDIILMDINLPGMDGYEALSRLRNYPQTRHIPVIAISAEASARDIERGQAAGFHAYITKPINVTELLECMEGLVQHTVARIAD